MQARDWSKPSMLSSRYYPLYPSLVGLLLGLLQTGLYLQLSFTLSSSIGTYLLVTLCWLLGSAIGALWVSRSEMSLRVGLILALIAYAACGWFLSLAPFESSRWILYAFLVILTGLYPGLFFARMAPYYRARTLFFLENNGFILGLAAGTLLFMIAGRAILWLAPAVVAMVVLLWDELFLRSLSAEK